MESEGLLSCQEEFAYKSRGRLSRPEATGPYLEPMESTPHPPPPSNLPKIHSDPILPSTPRSSGWSLSFGLSHQNLVHFPLPPMRATCSAHLILFDLICLIILGWLEIMTLLIVQLTPFFRHIIPLRSKYSPQNPVLKHPQSLLFSWCETPRCTPIQTMTELWFCIF
jgi:hypothetical protein